MLGKSYKHGRTIGRMGMNHDVRPSNRAEAGMGCAALIGVALILVLLIGVFL